MATKTSYIHEAIYVRDDIYICRNCGLVLQDPERLAVEEDGWSKPCDVKNLLVV